MALIHLTKESKGRVKLASRKEKERYRARRGEKGDLREAAISIEIMIHCEKEKKIIEIDPESISANRGGRGHNPQGIEARSHQSKFSSQRKQCQNVLV